MFYDDRPGENRSADHMNAMADDLFEEYLDLPDLAAQQCNVMWRFTSARAHDDVQPTRLRCPKHVYPTIAFTAGK